MEQNQQPQPPVFNPQQPAQQPVPQYQPRVFAKPMMDPVTAVKTCLKKFFDFKGRARRSEYWWFVLFIIIVSSVFNYGGLLVPALSFVGLACTLLFLIPKYSALTRRLHDTGRSGWWVLCLAVLDVVVWICLAILMMPVVGKLFEETDPFEQMTMLTDAIQSNPTVFTVMMCCSVVSLVITIITFIFSVQDSKWDENQYGPSPKYQ